jgi:hypothetical protein
MLQVRHANFRTLYEDVWGSGCIDPRFLDLGPIFKINLFCGLFNHDVCIYITERRIGGYLKGSSPYPIEICQRFYLYRLRKIAKIVSQDSSCPDRNSN